MQERLLAAPPFIPRINHVSHERCPFLMSAKDHPSWGTGSLHGKRSEKGFHRKGYLRDWGPRNTTRSIYSWAIMRSVAFQWIHYGSIFLDIQSLKDNVSSNGSCGVGQSWPWFHATSLLYQPSYACVFPHLIPSHIAKSKFSLDKHKIFMQWNRNLRSTWH